MDSKIMNSRAPQTGRNANEPIRLFRTGNEPDPAPPGLTLSVPPSATAEEPPRYLGSLRGRTGVRGANSTPASLSRNSKFAIRPGISNNSLGAAVDDSGSLSSLAISGVDLRALPSSKESSTFKSANRESQRAQERTHSSSHDQKETSPQRVSFDNPPPPAVQDKRETSRPLRKSDPAPPSSPILRKLGYLVHKDNNNNNNDTSPKARSASQSRSRATSPLRIIQQWSSSFHRAREEPFIPINPFSSKELKRSVHKPCRTCLSNHNQQHRRHSSPIPDEKSIAASSDLPYDCNHVAPFSALASTADTVRIFFIDTLPRYVYLNLLLRLPALYFSRVAKIFEDAEVSKPDVQRMVEAGGGGGFFSLPSRSEHDHLGHAGMGMGSPRPSAGSRAVSPGAVSGVGLSSQVAIAPAPQVVGQPLPCPEDWALPLVSPALLRFKASWEAFIDSLMREWKTLNLVSALLLSAICSIFQTNASLDPVIRNTAFMSLICALMSLSYGCMYIIRFGSMRSMCRASRWAEEARKSKTSLWWNVWVFLAMPAVWIAWSMMWFIASILSFVWRTGDVTNPVQPPPISAKLALIPRIGITAVFVLGLVYFFLIIKTLHQYGGSQGGTHGFFNPGEAADNKNDKSYNAAERGEKPSRGGAVSVAVEPVEGKTERRGRERTRRSGSRGERVAEGVVKKDDGEGKKGVAEVEESVVVGLGLTPGNMSNVYTRS